MAKTSKKYWDSEEVVGEVTLPGGKHKRVVSHVSRGDENFVSISTWKNIGEGEGFIATGGVTIPLGGYEGQKVFNLIATFFAAPQTPEQMAAREADGKPAKKTRKGADTNA